MRLLWSEDGLPGSGLLGEGLSGPGVPTARRAGRVVWDYLGNSGELQSNSGGGRLWE